MHAHETPGRTSGMAKPRSRSEQRIVVLATFATLLSMGCTRQLQPEPPSHELSQELRARAMQESPSEGQGVLILDVVGDPAVVEEVGGADGPHEVCRTPCVTQLSLGDHQLVFRRAGREDQVDLTVGSSPSAYRRNLSFDSGERHYTELALIGLVIAGGLSPILGPLTSIDGNDIREPEVGLIVAGALIGTTLVLGVVSAILALIDPQETREGASVQWQLDGT